MKLPKIDWSWMECGPEEMSPDGEAAATRLAAVTGSSMPEARGAVLFSTLFKGSIDRWAEELGKPTGRRPLQERL